MNLPKNYEPRTYEQDIYQLWEKNDAFKPKARGTKETFSIVMPPPNANANLHIGYALTVALEDIPARYHRMKGEATLLLPGADHAGFETQSVYEKHLAKAGKSRFDFSREELYQQIWDFVANNRQNYEQQFRALGTSCDWSRFTFTLDQKIIDRAYKTFKKMWDEGLIYRGERLVNYCTFHGTGFADIEVEYKEVNGKLWSIDYPLTDGSGVLTVATTRPETMLGDTAVAVHPDDTRHKDKIGKTVQLPLTKRELPVIADSFVDKEFGTGAVKLTPAHDQNDYDAAQRHDLPVIIAIGHDGKMTHEVPDKYRSLTVDQAREAVVKDLRKAKLLRAEEDYKHQVGHCYKCKTVIEPMLKEQWFVDMQPLAKQAIAALKAKKIKFYPDSKREQLIRYLEGLRDWNISRQIAWGIPIPAFVNTDDSTDWIFDRRTDQHTIEIEGKTYVRDPDVFDTWFSSSSWPYATLDYPDGEDFKHFYPLNLLETGGEILYPWVSRMIMLGLYVTDKIPFKEVYIHGHVMAEDGAKMSKSLGNVVDPFPIIDEYGSDALRMSLIAGRSAAQNSGYDSRKATDARNFCNKLWNIARYAESKLGEDYPTAKHPEPVSVADSWMLSKIQQGITSVSSLLEEYRFAEAYEHLYHLAWDDFADWYIEATKTDLNKDVLAYCLESLLKLAHPFAPFVTETIWQTLKQSDNSLLATSAWPTPVKTDKKRAGVFEEIRSIVTEIRYIKAALQTGNDISLYHQGDKLLKEQGALLATLAQINEVREVESGHGLYLTGTDRHCWLDIDQATAKRYLSELRTSLESAEKDIAALEGRLNNKSYTAKAPKQLVEETKQSLKTATQRRDKLADEIKRFEKIT